MAEPKTQKTKASVSAFIAGVEDETRRKDAKVVNEMPREITGEKPAMSGVVQLIDDSLLDATLARAKAAPRGRINHNFHPDLASNPHRFLNAWRRGSYAAPHRHLAVPKPESFVILRGELALFVFDDLGSVSERHVLGRAGLFGIDLAPGLWHTVAAVSETAVCFEVKAGPYDVATDKEFAPWAPLEGDPAAAAYLERLLAGLG